MPLLTKGPEGSAEPLALTRSQILRLESRLVALGPWVFCWIVGTSAGSGMIHPCFSCPWASAIKRIIHPLALCVWIHHRQPFPKLLRPLWSRGILLREGTLKEPSFLGNSASFHPLLSGQGAAAGGQGQCGRQRHSVDRVGGSQAGGELGCAGMSTWMSQMLTCFCLLGKWHVALALPLGHCPRAPRAQQPQG